MAMRSVSLSCHCGYIAIFQHMVYGLTAPFFLVVNPGEQFVQPSLGSSAMYHLNRVGISMVVRVGGVLTGVVGVEAVQKPGLQLQCNTMRSLYKVVWLECAK